MYLLKRRQELRDHFDWYLGNLDSLFRVSPTIVNGLTLIPAARITTRFNYFAAVSRFFSDAQLSDLPQMETSIAALIEELTQHWSVSGECCIIAGSTGQLSTVRPDYVHPVRNDFNKDLIEDFWFIFPLINQRTQFTEPQTPTRARVITFNVATGVALQSERDYREGWVADEPSGVPVDIASVVWVDTKDGVYHDMEGIVRELTIRINIMQTALNSVAFPLLQIDTDAVAGGKLQTGVTPEAVTAAATDGLGLTVPPPFIGEEGARYIERSGAGLTESLEYQRSLLAQLGVVSGVPDYVFGVRNPVGAANETQRILFAGQAKIARFRRDLTYALSIVGVTVEFSGEPFVTREEKVTGLIAQFKEGILTLNEVRIALGRSVTEGGNTFMQAVRMMFGGNDAS